jgi:hypothetical protein
MTICRPYDYVPDRALAPEYLSFCSYSQELLNKFLTVLDSMVTFD